MGSRIMHSIIGHKIAKALSIEDKTSFLLGSVAPDAVFSYEEKNLSHFFIGDVQDYSRRVDFKRFLHKYSRQVENKNDYIMGYYAHLMADDIWLRGFNLSWLRNRMDANEGLYTLYHNDFRLLNGKLLEHYGFTDELRETLRHFPAILDLEEVKAKDVEKFVPYVLGDMEYDQEVLNEELNVFTFEQIIGYIETSVDLGILKIKPLYS
ncbi:zinc dependent phospholipase C family protein [Lederbergia sp. NSJ-179]|uniref:zinc dependent phospholipase C family protein n=1 Tax=Lederbergia sp. NSJ-179 TaxID=2931402 RepID=UPI001FD112E5|nr:zinc dependent phospholipase C family protein [Lederbergia sp. NSJ-179]MCJ7842811.1 zinc dependent phospholipase C family protein [Lederbergia sp. NSJ-179]